MFGLGGALPPSPLGLRRDTAENDALPLFALFVLKS